MTIVVQSTDENRISLPIRYMRALNLREGDEVKAVFDGENLRLTPLDKFLALRGALANDEQFDEAMQLVSEAWQSWIPAESA